ncbi:MAG: nucleotide 5'-monophosphate nucleosidase PpnN [Gammaproteobacteria bacterium]|nr:nucleotide 5'-monophosphate nucleosidase PpnN [Gammaproteobacteria bacterium]MDH3505652.1 nucleotide 5'-monophosphate nucleosidase PpnN [Gammaproteobacteria bacterium]
MPPRQDIVEVMPERSLEVLSQEEVSGLLDATAGRQREILRRCSLAVLNVGSATDDTRAILEQFADFQVEIVQQDRGVKLRLINAPADAFVDGKMIRGIREQLFSVLRDVVYVSSKQAAGHFDLGSTAGVTDAVFRILRNADVLKTARDPNLVVCWGGHAIGRDEYDFTKDLGYQLGLRGLDVCTGCGLGAMKGPMKGAAIAHAKQRILDGRYVGITEPGIIAAESPNPIVNELVIMPDIEKRLEAFVRVAHAIVIFPGGAGTAEELLFLLGILMQPANRDVPVPVILAGPAESEPYFRVIDRFVMTTLGEAAREHYRIEIGEPAATAALIRNEVQRVATFRHENADAYYFNWRLQVDSAFQEPFVASHESMASLQLRRDHDPHELAVHLRRAFSGIVAGNVKDYGIRTIEKHGPFELHADREVMQALDELLAGFVAQKRMRLSGAYEPCYRLSA